jgi:DNA-binding winged helix-turn-helix (wHTH) protein
MPHTVDSPGPAWRTAHFSDCIVDRQHREVILGGMVERIEPRAFDILLLLLDRRGQVVTKDDLVQACWGAYTPTQSAVARAVMKARRAIGDTDSHWLQTAHGSGYRLVGSVEFDRQPPASEDGDRAPAPSEASSSCRLMLLPFANATLGNSCGWAELGLVSLIAKSLDALPAVSVVPLRDVLAALRGIAPSADPRARLTIVESTLGPGMCVWGELRGGEGRFILHFNLRAQEGALHRGTVIGSDPGTMAVDAVQQLRQWIAPLTDASSVPRALDLADPFLNSVFARALQCVSEERLHEADHLLALLRECGVRHPSVLQETARVLLSLGRADAGDYLPALEATSRQDGGPKMLALSRSLQATHLELQGRIPESIAATLEAVDIAQAAGLADLTARLMVTCASRMAMGSDARADALLSQAILRAERLGNRVVLCDAYCAAGRVAGFRNDWNSALHHQLSAVAIADSMHEASRSWAYGALSWVQSELGMLNEAARSGAIGFRAARLSGAEPQQGLAAGQAALAYLACRRIQDTVALYASLKELADDTSVSMLAAREGYCRASLLALTGRFDDALAILGEVMAAARGHPRLLARFQASKLRLLLRARRFDALVAECNAIRRTEHTCRDTRLEPLIERALALREHLALADTQAALRRLDRLARSQPASEVHAAIGLETAWIHLELGSVGAAAALVDSLQTWLEQSQAGLLVAARLQYARGDWSSAVELQRKCLLRFNECSTPAQHAGLAAYERAQAQGRQQEIEILDTPLTQDWGIVAEIRRKMPAELGGG